MLYYTATWVSSRASHLKNPTMSSSYNANQPVLPQGAGYGVGTSELISLFSISYRLNIWGPVVGTSVPLALLF